MGEEEGEEGTVSEAEDEAFCQDVTLFPLAYSANTVLCEALTQGRLLPSSGVYVHWTVQLRALLQVFRGALAAFAAKQLGAARRRLLPYPWSLPCRGTEGGQQGRNQGGRKGEKVAAEEDREDHKHVLIPLVQGRHHWLHRRCTRGARVTNPQPTLTPTHPDTNPP